VINMATEASDAAIVRSTIELAHSLGIAVVAEGVETDDAARRLAELGCDSAQGYLISRPLPADDLTAWLEANPGRPWVTPSPVHHLPVDLAARAPTAENERKRA
jgi:EAL domain-containing protein (putative c-di-GMP-specific phosphodiesterase class I)